MSHQLWRAYLEDDLESFKKLVNAGQRPTSNTVAARAPPIVGSPSSKNLSTSPTHSRKSQGNLGKVTPSKGKAAAHTLAKADVNARDHQGLTLLHWIASSYGEDAPEYATSLLDLPSVDVSVPDSESAWTALHRALYFGNVTIARKILNRDYYDRGSVHAGPQAGSLIKLKDREGNSPFDLYNSSVASRKLKNAHEELTISAHDDDDSVSLAEEDPFMPVAGSPSSGVNGDELFMFGSNKNLNLGVGDEDDRQFPERISLQKPKHLLQHLHLEHLSKSLSRKNRRIGNDQLSDSLDLSGDVPALVQFSRTSIRDVQLSKLHTAILTDDPEANLYMCGFGPGGRLGTGDESTRFSFTCVFSGGLRGQKIMRVGLGQNHTLAITQNGEVFSWGSNNHGQLGYSLAVTKDEEPVQLLPRQIFGPLKRETVIGCAASRIHSVVFTSEHLYTFGKNEGQLGLTDSDARSLEIQTTPRVVAAALFPEPIVQATAIDRATACLLENHDVWVFANYGYLKVKFPWDDFSNFFLKATYATSRYGSEGPNQITKICSGGDTICALAREGQVFTIKISQSAEPSGKGSTTNPVKIRNALSEPQKIWSLRKDSMACADVSVGQDGSIIICTKSGSVWRRVVRTKVKDSTGSKGKEHGKDFKFSRVPGLTRISAVRSNAYGSYAAICQDWDVLQSQVHVAKPSLWHDMFSLCPFKAVKPVQSEGRLEIAASPERLDIMDIRRAVLETKDVEGVLSNAISGLDSSLYDLSVGSTSSELRFPCHEFLVAGRSSVLRHGLAVLRESYLFKVPDIVTIEYDDVGKPLILFQGLDILTLSNLVLYLYTDSVVDVWHYTRHAPSMTMRYKQVRVELQKTADRLRLQDLERAARIQVHPGKTLHRDMEQAYIAPGFFEAADLEIELNGVSFHAHRALMIQRCPFFEGMFAGHSGGGWIKSRYDRIGSESEKVVSVDLKHIEPHIFDLVLRFLYADTGPEIFDELASADLESFLDIVVDVMSVANELMIDRLAEVCQNILGKYVNVRNVCQLLNAVAPCSVSSFKQAALEYICLNLEIMLENHLLDELDDDIMLELDEVVRGNQNSFFGITRRGEIADEALLERYPDLVERLDFARKRKIDSIRLHQKRMQREEDERLGQISKSPRLAPKSPKLSGKSSAHDLLFDMDEEGGRSPQVRPFQDRDRRPSRLSLAGEDVWIENHGKNSMGRNSMGKVSMSASPGITFGSLNEMASPIMRPVADSPQDIGTIIGPSTPSKSGPAPWGSVPLRSDKLDMKSIMAQADDRKHSNISAGLSTQNSIIGKFKMSQKDRKKLQEQQKRQAELEAETKTEVDSQGRPVAWQKISAGSKVSLKHVLGQANQPSASTTDPPARVSPGPLLTMRQTVPGNAASRRTPSKSPAFKPAPSRTPAPSPKSSSRSVSSPQISSRAFSSPSTKVTTQPRPSSPGPAEYRPLASSTSSPSIPRSVRHLAAPAEPSLQLSMADILTQQQLEKEVIKEAAAKRSLQEIQEEQAFQEWWDAEEKATKERMQAEEQASTSTSRRPTRSSRGRGGISRGKTSGRGRNTDQGQSRTTDQGRGKNKQQERGKIRGDAGSGLAAQERNSSPAGPATVKQ